MSDESSWQTPTQGVPRTITIERLFVKMGREEEVIRCVLIAHAFTGAEGPRCNVGRQFQEDGSVEVVAVSIWNTPNEMRRVVGSEYVERPVGLAEFSDALQGWTVTTYDALAPSEDSGPFSSCRIV
jgi:hypothetical protein